MSDLKNKLAKSKKRTKEEMEAEDEQLEETETNNVMGGDDKEEYDFPEEDLLKQIEEQFEMVSEDNKVKEPSKIPITLDAVPKEDEELIITSENSEKYQRVPVSFRVNVIRKVLKIIITLHKIPEKFVQLDVEDDHFTVDTLGYSKKMWIQRKYPGLIQVQKEKVKATFMKNGLVLVTIPLKSIPKETLEYHVNMIKEKQQARKIKFPQPIKKSILKQAQQMEKKRRQRERKKEKKNYIDNQMDLKKKKKKKKTSHSSETKQ